MIRPSHVAAHTHSIRNRDEVLASDTCGCFYCLSTFPPAEVRKWIEEGDGSATASCPRCGIDSVIGSASEYPVSADFLRAMRRHRFEA